YLLVRLYQRRARAVFARRSTAIAAVIVKFAARTSWSSWTRTPRRATTSTNTGAQDAGGSTVHHRSPHARTPVA
ncbi:hypothetical protein, partial [Streptomyces sp. NPDC051098]|uniref:hypothetical protein n=1 Tax=Streptomyces sp. NPDC051098 TaxID=3155411 RepID=UPI00341CE77C